MMNPIVDKLFESLKHGSLFSHTNIGLAEQHFASLNVDNLDRVSVAIVGDTDITDKAAVSICLTSVLAIFERRDNIRIQTGRLDGVEAFVREFAKRNDIELDIHECGQLDDWTPPSVKMRRERDRRIVAAANVVVVINSGKSKECNYIANLAMKEGRLVTVRKITSKGKKNTKVLN